MPTPDHLTLVLSASTRVGSVNSALARRIVRHLNEQGRRAELVDLADYELPMYQGDLEVDDGVPDAAKALVVRVAEARRLVIVSPEYNGAFPPLLKNTIDWMTRVDRGMFGHLEVSLAAASPGGLGGRRVLAVLRTWMENMRVDVAEQVLSVPHASLGDDGELQTDDPVDLDAFIPSNDDG